MKSIKLISSYFLPYKSTNAFAIGKKILGIYEKYHIEVFSYELDSPIEDNEGWFKRLENISIKYIAKENTGLFRRLKDNFSFYKSIKDSGDAIISYFHLSEVAYLCYFLKKKYNIPWIAIYSDPPFHMSPFLIEENKKIKMKVINLIVSTIPNYITLKSADKIIFNDKWQAKYILGDKYDKYRDKVEIIQMGVEFTKANDSNSKKTKDKIIFRYLGNLTGPRNAVEFIKALDLYVEKYPKYKENLIVECYGIINSKETLEVYESMKNKGVISFNDTVSYKEAQKLMKESDVLLVIDGNLEGITRIYPYTPSKILDYLAEYKPILAVSMDNSPTHDICTETNNYWSNFNINNIVENIKNCIENYEQHKYNDELLIIYSNEYKSRQFKSVIDSVIINK